MSRSWDLSMFNAQDKNGRYFKGAALKPSDTGKPPDKGGADKGNADFNKFFGNVLKSMGMGDMAKNLGLDGGKDGQQGGLTGASAASASAFAKAGPDGASASAAASASSAFSQSKESSYNYNYTFDGSGKITSFNGSGSGSGESRFSRGGSSTGGSESLA
jgi:hypothetical protein